MCFGINVTQKVSFRSCLIVTRTPFQSPGPGWPPIKPRGGWPRAELHYGSISQYASVYTISHAVRSSGEATEDPLKSEFLASFRCKCWTLNVILLQNCSDYLTNTWWSTKTIKTWVFLRLSPRVKTSPRVIGLSIHADGYVQHVLYISCHFLTFIDTRMIVVPEYCSFTLLSL